MILVCLSLVLGASNVVAPVDAGLLSVSLVGLVGSLPIGYAVGPRYVPKWKKQACEIPAAQHPKSHYVCDEAGEVKCLPGWTGDLCDVPLCRKGCDPLQGYCRRPGECRCKLGYYGELCDKCVPLPGCLHGRCNVSFECTCDPGWKGIFCSEPICDSDCHPNQSYCEKPGECRCRLGWQGPKCKQCLILPGCVHGTCQGPFECRCEPGWTGILCQTPICAAGCSRENGGCRKPGTCRCKVGWTGPNCTQCYPYPGCVHGTCKRPWECRCNPGWTGDYCEEKLTFCDDHLTVCQNNGTCISMTKENGDYRCICPLAYGGRQCQVESLEPASDLMPPTYESMSTQPLFPMITSSTQVPQQQHNSKEDDKKSSINTESNYTLTTSFNHTHQGHHLEFPEDNHQLLDDGITVEPLGPIVVTDPPPTVMEVMEPLATAGKWPTELPLLSTESITDNTFENEA